MILVKYRVESLSDKRLENHDTMWFGFAFGLQRFFLFFLYLYENFFFIIKKL